MEKKIYILFLNFLKSADFMAVEIKRHFALQLYFPFIYKHCMKLEPNCKRRLANRIFSILLFFPFLRGWLYYLFAHVCSQGF